MKYYHVYLYDLLFSLRSWSTVSIAEFRQGMFSNSVGEGQQNYFRLIWIHFNFLYNIIKRNYMHLYEVFAEAKKYVSFIHWSAVISLASSITTCMWLSSLMSIIQPLACGCHLSCRLYNYLHVAVTSYVNYTATCMWLSSLMSIV